MVAFGFLPQNFGRWWGRINGTLSFYEFRLNGGDTQMLPVAIVFVLNFLHSETVVMLKHLLTPVSTLTLRGGRDNKTLFLHQEDGGWWV